MCDELSLISSKDLKSIEDTQNLRIQYLEEISPLKAQKEIYMKLYNKTDNAADKTILKARINILNEDIERLNKKIQTCRRIINKAEKGERVVAPAGDQLFMDKEFHLFFALYGRESVE